MHLDCNQRGTVRESLSKPFAYTIANPSILLRLCLGSFVHLILTFSLGSGYAHAQIINGDFSAGNTGWTSVVPADGSVSYAGDELTVIGTDDSGGTNEVTLSQQAVTTGDTLEFDLISYTNSDGHTYDYPVLVIDGALYALNSDGTVTPTAGGDGNGGTAGPGSANIHYTVSLAPGAHTIGFGVLSTDACCGPASATFDNISTNLGNVVLSVATIGSDGEFQFSSQTTGLGPVVSTSNGSGQSQPVDLPAGTYTTSINLPTGFALTAVSCTDDDSTGNIATKSATISLQVAEAVTCTFSVTDSRPKTTQAIGRFLKRRNDLLLSHEHGQNRQIDRLRRFAGTDGPGVNGSYFSAGGQTFLGGPPHVNRGGKPAAVSRRETEYLGGGIISSAPLTAVSRMPGSLPQRSVQGLTVTVSDSNSASFYTSLGEARQATANNERQRVRDAIGDAAMSRLGGSSLKDDIDEPWAFDVWIEGHWSRFDDDTSGAEASGHFGLVSIGADYVVNPSILVGVMAQYDDTDETSNTQATQIHGRGWMVGPYATIAIAQDVYFQARAAWGQSENDISPFMTYTDTFDTTRWLLRGRLEGRYSIGDLQVAPSASIAYIKEHQESYVDSLGVTIPNQTVSLGQAQFGPVLSYMLQSDGYVITPTVGIKGVWNFAGNDNTALVAAQNVGAQDLRGKVEAGVRIGIENGSSIEVSGTYDGIGDSDYEAMGGQLQIRVPLQ